MQKKIIHKFEVGNFKYSIQENVFPNFTLLKNTSYLCTITGMNSTSSGEKKMEFVACFEPQNAYPHDKLAIRGAIRHLENFCNSSVVE